jgi:hypothetical protein
MCDAVSFYQDKAPVSAPGYFDVRDGKNDRILFLSDKEIKTPKGKKFAGNISHDAVRKYFNITGSEPGMAKGEMTDFSDPKNFPSAISNAIRKGQMKHLLETLDIDYVKRVLLSDKAAKKVDDFRQLWTAFKETKNRSAAWKD